nr:hypothetical protein [Rhodococcus sp. T2V]
MALPNDPFASKRIALPTAMPFLATRSIDDRPTPEPTGGREMAIVTSALMYSMPALPQLRMRFAKSAALAAA